MSSWISLGCKIEQKSKEKEKKRERELSQKLSKTLQIVMERKSMARNNEERERKNVLTPQCPFLKFGGKKRELSRWPHVASQ
jgi:hypothetical protein